MHHADLAVIPVREALVRSNPDAALGISRETVHDLAGETVGFMEFSRAFIRVPHETATHADQHSACLSTITREGVDAILLHTRERDISKMLAIAHGNTIACSHPEAAAPINLNRAD